jgi:hypothetical protein
VRRVLHRIDSVELLKPAHIVGDLLVQHLDALEQEAAAKGGIQRLLDVWSQVEARHVEGMSEEERVMLRHLLQHVLNNLA